MAEGGYYDAYGSMDGTSGLIPGVGYRPPGSSSNYGDGTSNGEKGSSHGPGYYAEQYSGMSSGGGGGAGPSGAGDLHSPHPTSPDAMPLHPLSGGHQDAGALGGMPSSHGGQQHHASSVAASASAGLLVSLPYHDSLSSSAPRSTQPSHHPSSAPSQHPTPHANHYTSNRQSPLSPTSPTGSTSAIARAISLTQQQQRRPRSEKKPIPEDLKDIKYFERRKRNNVAAKKSRDARKAREDEIAIRASFLEKENAVLRAQVATLREEANSLRQLLLQKRSRP